MMKTLLSVLVFLFIGVELKGQVVLYSTDFGTTVGAFPTGWLSSNTTNGFEAVTTSASTGYSGASGNINARFRNTGTTGATHTLTLNNSLSTVGYSNIRVIWGVRTTPAFSQSVTLEWSTDGVNWEVCPFSQTPSSTDWTLVNGGIPIQLPAGAGNVPNLRLRWSIVVTNNGNYQIDDVTIDGLLISGGSSSSDYFRSKQSGNWNASASWESSSDNINWINSTLIPTSSAQTITIRNGHLITIDGSIIADQLIIENEAELSHPNPSIFTLNDGVGDDLIIYGTYIYHGSSPSGLGNYVVESGGVIRADANTGGIADNLPLSSNTRVLFKTGSFFEWNNTSQFGGNGVTYFNSDLERPIFKVTQNIGLSIGASGTLLIKGLFEANGNLTFTGTGSKIFRDGIIGAGTITQLATSGSLQISGNDAQLGGSGTMILDAAGLQLNADAQVLLTANKTINNSTFTNNGIFNCQAFVVSGSTSFVNASGASLGIGSADGITTGAAGNIQTTGGRTFNDDATYVYNGTTNQVTGNALPVAVQVLSISSFGTSGNNTVTLTTNNTTASRLNLNNGYFVAGENRNLNIEVGGAIFGTGGFQPNDPVSGTITFKGNGKTEGTLTGYPHLYAVIINGGVNFNGDLLTESATILNRLQINNGAFVQVNAPYFAAGSSLVYNTNGVYGRNIEWGNSTGLQGYPHHVIVQGNTILDLFTNPVNPDQLEIGGNLIIGNANGRGQVYMNNNMNKPLYVKGNLIIGSNDGASEGSRLWLSQSSGGDLWLEGSFTRQTNSFYDDNGRSLHLKGSTSASINTPGTITPGIISQEFSQLRLEKTGLPAPVITLNCSVGITNEITFTSGVVTTSNNNLLIVKDEAESYGGNTSSFVNGPLRKVGDNAFTFHVGKIVGSEYQYRTIGMSAPDNNNDAFTAEFRRANARLLGDPVSPLQRVSQCEYWSLDHTNAGGPTLVNVTLSWTEQSPCNVSYVTDLPTLAVAKLVGTSWYTLGNAVTTGDVENGTITAATSTNVGSDFFTLASTDLSQNPLPFALSSFTARSRKTDIAIDWMLTNNNDFNEFVIERSKDGVRFEKLKMVQAKVILNTAAYAEEDNHPFTGWNYYRLRAVDKTGKERISQTVKVWFGRQELIRISPNPASEKILINFAEPSSISQIELVNIAGQVLQRIQTVTFNTEINIAHLQAGMYVLRITGKNGLSTKSFMKQ